MCGCVHKLVCEPMLCGLAVESWGYVAGVVIAYLHSKYFKYSLCWVHARQRVPSSSKDNSVFPESKVPLYLLSADWCLLALQTPLPPATRPFLTSTTCSPSPLISHTVVVNVVDFGKTSTWIDGFSLEVPAFIPKSRNGIQMRQVRQLNH